MSTPVWLVSSMTRYLLKGIFRSMPGDGAKDASHGAAAGRSGRRDPRALRQLSDPTAIRALAHPTRQALLELLRHEGAMTATQCGEQLGESAAGCSFHLRQLAKYGFVEESAGGRGRNRPWQLTEVGFQTRSADMDATGKEVSRRFGRFMIDRNLRRLRAHLEHSDPDEETLSSASDTVFYVTDEELEEINREIVTLFTRFHDRIADLSRRPADARMIYGLAFLFPTSPLAGSEYDNDGPPDA